MINHLEEKKEFVFCLLTEKYKVIKNIQCRRKFTKGKILKIRQTIFSKESQRAFAKF